MHSPVVLYKQEGNLNVWLRSLLKRFFLWVVVLVWYYSAGLWSLARPPLCYYSCCCCLKGPLNTIGKIWEKLRGSSRRKVSHGAAVQTFAQTLLLLPCMVCVCVLCLPMTTLSENRRPEPMRHGDFIRLLCWIHTYIFFILELDRWEQNYSRFWN